MRLDYMIKILTQDVVPDFMCSHIRCGLGSQARRLCKTEEEAQKRAQAILFEEAEAHVQEHTITYANVP